MKNTDEPFEVEIMPGTAFEVGQRLIDKKCPYVLQYTGQKMFLVVRRDDLRKAGGLFRIVFEKAGPDFPNMLNDENGEKE